MPLVPDWAEYVRREAAGILFLVTARLDGELVGYITIQVAPGFHYATTTTATTDIVYIVPEYRNRGYALPLFKRAQKELKLRGVKIWISCFKEKKSLGMPEFLKAFGFTEADIYYSKWIG